MVPGATQTLIFYAHSDGQPVNPAQWAPGLEPFVPKLFTNAIDKGGTNIPFPADGSYQHDWKIYARGAADDKAGIGAILNAYDALVKKGLTPGCNLKFFFEGEEEAGSATSMKFWKNTNRCCNLTSGLFVMAPFTSRAKNKLYSVPAETPIWI